jgi:hypothetical protein
MRMRRAAVVAGLALGLMSGAAKAASLGYNVDLFYSNANDTIEVSGTITTDGKAGSLDESDIVDVALSFSNGGGISGASSVSISGNDLVAIGNALQFNYDPEGFAEFTTQSSGLFFEADMGSYDTAVGNNGVFITMGEAQGSTSLIGLSEGVAGLSPVPLPASAPMFGAALLALGAAGYGLKRKKAAASA